MNRLSVRTKWNWVIALGVVLLIGASLLIKYWPVEKTSESALRAVFIENASCWPFFVAMENGLFEKAGLHIEAIKAQDSTEAMNALVAKQADISVENTYSVIFAIQARSPGLLKLLVPCAETETKYVSHLLVLADSPLSDAKQLKGKRIGTYSGATQLLTLKLFLSRHLQMDPDKDVSIVQVAPPLQVQALAAGQFDALFTIEPFASAALAKGIAKDILPYARGRILNPFPAGACSARADVVTAKPVTLHRFYEAMVRAKEFIDREPEQSRNILAKWTNSDAASAAFVKGYEYYAFGEFDDVKMARVQELADLYSAADILPKKIEVGSMFLKADDIK